MTITTQYNSNNSLTPEFKWASLEKSKEVINIPTKAEEDLWSKIRLGPKIHK